MQYAVRQSLGRNVVLYLPADQVLLSGFTWEATQKQIASKAYLIHQPHGDGHVVAFAEDPNYRGFCDGLNLLFMNSIFFGPAHWMVHFPGRNFEEQKFGRW